MIRASPIAATSPSTPFGKYLFLQRIAVGGMAELFLARDTETDQLVVVKRILTYLSQEPEFVQMFVDEARIAAQLHHPNIVEVHELGKLQNSLFLAMEYLNGADLRKLYEAERSKGRTVPARIAAHITAELCAGLQYAHHRMGLDGKPMGIIHRDVNPQNVMIAADGKVKLVDFGIAKATAMMERSKPGVIKGKFLYLAPEQLTRDRLDHRSDLFSVGSMLYEVTVGKAPFAKSTSEAVIFAIRSEDPPAPHELRPGYPLELSRIIMRCLIKDRERRYQDAADVRRDLLGYLEGNPLKEGELQAYVRSYLEEAERTDVVDARIFGATPPPPPKDATPSVSKRITAEFALPVEYGEEPKTEFARPAELKASGASTEQGQQRDHLRTQVSKAPAVPREPPGTAVTRVELPPNAPPPVPDGEDERDHSRTQRLPVPSGLQEALHDEDSATFRTPRRYSRLAFVVALIVGLSFIGGAAGWRIYRVGGGLTGPQAVRVALGLSSRGEELKHRSMPRTAPTEQVKAAAQADPEVALATVEVSQPSDEPPTVATPPAEEPEPTKPTERRLRTRRTRVAVVFNAPSGTAIYKGRSKIVPNRIYRMAPGDLAVRYRCPGSRQFSNSREFEISGKRTKAQVFRLPCRGK